jgi:uncharacterized repeat protein (TIGR03847 family)
MPGFFDFDDIDTFTTGALGRPGQRTFFLQVRLADQRVNVKCEKQQVAAIAQYVRRLLSDLPAPEDRPLPQALELSPPNDADFIVGPIGLAYDQELDRFVLMLEEVVETDEEGEPLPESIEDQGRLRFRLTRGQALAFCDHAEVIVSAGRPTCMFCGQPMDPDGHPCPRMN